MSQKGAVQPYRFALGPEFANQIGQSQRLDREIIETGAAAAALAEAAAIGEGGTAGGGRSAVLDSRKGAGAQLQGFV